MKRPYENIVQDFKMTAIILLINHFMADEQLPAESDPDVLSQSLTLFPSQKFSYRGPLSVSLLFAPYKTSS